MGALRGAILGDVAATPKMAELAYEDGTGSASLSALCGNLLGHKTLIRDSQHNMREINSHLNEEESYDCRNKVCKSSVNLKCIGLTQQLVMQVCYA
ncbi:hypothetical protein EPR50_G00086020 [Perca flavescens]|uniref:Uncharacterized protein n=1 Tax=Perca flavescens TaxID=8167 RepID=A0A484D2D7_PERFV|nr:hypothetical protein EPR50_G00086020 [Perca flavescens]